MILMRSRLACRVLAEDGVNSTTFPSRIHLRQRSDAAEGIANRRISSSGAASSSTITQKPLVGVNRTRRRLNLRRVSSRGHLTFSSLCDISCGGERQPARRESVGGEKEQPSGRGSNLRRRSCWCSRRPGSESTPSGALPPPLRAAIASLSAMATCAGDWPYERPLRPFLALSAIWMEQAPPRRPSARTDAWRR